MKLTELGEVILELFNLGVIGFAIDKPINENKFDYLRSRIMSNKLFDSREKMKTSEELFFSERSLSFRLMVLRLKNPNPTYQINYLIDTDHFTKTNNGSRLFTKSQFRTLLHEEFYLINLSFIETQIHE